MRARLGTVVLKSELNVLVSEINACHRTAVERMQHLFDSQRHCLSGKSPEPFKLFPLRSEAARRRAAARGYSKVGVEGVWYKSINF